jgi:ComEC/Rec2-related protein
MRLRSPYPFLWIGAGSAVGILLAQWDIAGLITALVIAVGAGLLWWRGWADRGIWGLGLFALIGWLRTWWDSQPPPNALPHLIGKIGYLHAHVLEEPLPTRKAIRLLLQATAFQYPRDSLTYPITGRLLLYTHDASALALLPGQQLLVLARMDSVKFGQAYWHAQEIYVSAFSNEWKALDIERTYLMGYFYRWRHHLIQAMRQRFPDQSAARALVEALLLGYKRGLDPETRTAFQLSGTAHILAVSGLHVGLVLTFTLFLLGRFLPPGSDRHPAVTFPLIALLFFYGFLTAASPSAMRAVLMGSTALLARMLYRPYAALNALGFAAFVQLLFSSKVIYNLGFQLSYAAVAGILAWYGPFRQLLNSLERLPYAGGYLRDLLAVSIAAQLGTLGLSWAYFGQFPLYFLVANLVAIPLGTLLSYTGFLWLLTLKVPFLSTTLGWSTLLLSKSLIFAVSLITTLPGKALSLPAIPATAGVVLSLAAILGGFLYQTLRPKKKVELIL